MSEKPYQAPQTADGSLPKRRLYDSSTPPLVALVIFRLICMALLIYAHGSTMRNHLRTLLILITLTAYLVTTVVCIKLARPLAEAAADYVMELGARAVFRGVCYATFD